MVNIHLITTCAKSKNGDVKDSIFPNDIIDIRQAFSEWSLMVRHRYQQRKDITEAKNLYRGAHWKTALEISNHFPNVSLWVISAGLGLRHSSDPTMPYEASFSFMPHDSSDVWALHIREPILPGRICSLSELLGTHNADRFVLAASPLYLKAIEHDLLDGINKLSDPFTQVTIATTKAYAGNLLPYVKCTNQSMMSELGANMTTLNIKHAKRILEGNFFESDPYIS
jgi:hypothetical protein